MAEGCIAAQALAGLEAIGRDREVLYVDAGNASSSSNDPGDLAA
jgi:hypothetical protein